MLTFDAEAHAYTLGGAPVPSVTQVLKPLVNFDGVPPALLEKARNFGIAAHKMVALEIAGTLDYGTLDEGLYPALDGFTRWRLEHPEISDALDSAIVEQQMGHKRLKYAGTPDIIIDAVLVIDIKTRKPKKLVDSIQCAGYEHLHLANGGTKAKYEHRILYLNPNGGYEFVKVNHREAWSRFRLMLDHWKNAKNINSWE